jgi:hypothetical protein
VARGCGRVVAPLLIMIGLSGKRRTDRLTVDPAKLSTQVSSARAAGLSHQLTGINATAGQAHNALADTAALLTDQDGTLGPGYRSPDVVALMAPEPAPERTATGWACIWLWASPAGPHRPDGAARISTYSGSPSMRAGTRFAQLAGLPAPALVVV